MQQLSRHDLQWALRRAPRHVLEMMKQNGPSMIVAGGFIRSCVANEPINDIDVFAPSKEVAKTWAYQLAADTKSRFHKSDNAFSVAGRGLMVQFIHRWTFTEPVALLESFDFTVACAAFWWDGEKWTGLCDDDFYADLAAKRLVYRSPARNEDAGGSMLRVLKFYQRGYRIPLDSLGTVVARLAMGVKEIPEVISEEHLAKVLTNLLREVDPNIDPSHVAHLPSLDEEQGADA